MENTNFNTLTSFTITQYKQRTISPLEPLPFFFFAFDEEEGIEEEEEEEELLLF
jgi:hypothetical protein